MNNRWKLNLYIIWFSQVLSLTSFGFGMPFLPFYLEELGITDPDKLKIYTGIVTAAPAITMAIMAPIWGVLADKFGKKLMLTRAVFFAIVILSGMGIATKPEHIIILRLAQGVFTGTITASSALVASNTPDDKLSYALGFLSSSTFIGFSLGPAIGGQVAEYAGYRISFFIGAALMLVDLIIVLLFVKETKVVTESVIVKDQSKKMERLFKELKEVLNPTIVSMLLLIFMLRITRSIFNPYLPLYVQETINTSSGAAGISGNINAVSSVATAIAGITISRYGDNNKKSTIMKMLLILAIVVSIGMTMFKNINIFALFYSLTFFALGGVEPMITSISSRNTLKNKRGALFGIQSLVGSVGWFLSPIIGSYLSIQYSILSIAYVIPVTLLLMYIVITILNKRNSNIFT